MIADYIKLRPDRIGWTLLVYTEDQVHEFTVGDVIQFTEETERTLGRWLADGPADFHCTDDPLREALLTIRDGGLVHGVDSLEGARRIAMHALDADLVRDLERGK